MSQPKPNDDVTLSIHLVVRLLIYTLSGFDNGDQPATASRRRPNDVTADHGPEFSNE